MAKAKLAQATYKLLPSSFPEKVVNTVKGLYLSTATGAERHIAGVSLSQGFNGVVGAPAEVGADYLRSLATGTPRQSSLVATPRGARAYYEGFKQGTKDFVSAMKTGVDPEIVGNSFDLSKANAEAPGILGAAMRYVKTFVSARNKPFFEGGMRVNLLEQAQVLATREGLSGAGWSDRVNTLLAKPTDEMVANAISRTNDAVLADESPIAKGIKAASNYLESRTKSEAPLPLGERVKRYVIAQGFTGDAVHDEVSRLMATKTVREMNDLIGPRQQSGLAQSMAQTGRVGAALGYTALNLTAPFPRIGQNIAAKGIAFSPLGLLKTALETGMAEPGDRFAVATRGLTKAAVGTATGMGVGYYLASKGRMGTDEGDSPAQKEQNRLEGKPSGTWVKIGGDYHVFPDAAAPASLMPLMGVLLWKQREQHPEQSMAGAVASSQGAYLGDVAKHSVAAAMQGLGSGLMGQDKNAAQQLIGQGLPVPPILGQAARSIDRQPRDTRDANPFVGAGKQALSKIPFASELLPAQTNVFGTVPPRGTSGAANVAQQFFDPSRPSADLTQGEGDRARLLREMDRLDVHLGEPPKTMKIGQTAVQRTPAEQRAFETENGPKVVAAAIAMMESPTYQRYAGQPKVQAMLLHAALLQPEKQATGLERLQRYQASPSTFTNPTP
jgi:hypothetical protein